MAPDTRAVITTCVHCGQPARREGHVDPDRDVHRAFVSPHVNEIEPTRPSRHAYEAEFLEGTGWLCKRCGWGPTSLVHRVF